jgi:hypothetical protein
MLADSSEDIFDTKVILPDMTPYRKTYKDLRGHSTLPYFYLFKKYFITAIYAK